MAHCPHCYKDPLKAYSGEELYNMGAYNIDCETNIECGECRETIVMRPYESVDHEFEKVEDDEN